MSFGMFVTPIDDGASMESLELYASYSEEETLYDDPGKWKDYCDGMTSPTSPRYADDRSGMLWMESPENARLIQRILREDVIGRVNSGEYRPARLPSWYRDIGGGLLTPEVLAPVSASVALLVSQDITAGQAEGAARGMLLDFGVLPSGAQMTQWLSNNRNWELF